MAQKTIFITGASSGIGLASALRLHPMGFRILAGVLPGENTDALTQAGIEIIPINITKPEMIAHAAERIGRIVAENGLYGLFNNAGTGFNGPLEVIPMAAIRQQLDVNLFGHIEVTQHLLPQVRKARGRIVNTASILGRITVPFGGPYCMSKFAMEAFTDTLRTEVKPFGIHVSAIEPGTIATNIWAKVIQQAEEIYSELPQNAQALYAERMQMMSETTQKTGAAGISPDHVAKAVAHAFTASRPKTRYVVGADAKLASALRWLLPDRWFEAVMERQYPSVKNPSAKKG